MDDKKMFGEMVKQLRKEKGMTQDELAEKCGFASKSAISHIETGIRDVKRDTIAKLADALGCDLTYLIDVDSQIVLEVEKCAKYILDNATKERLLKYASAFLEKAQEDK